MDYEQQWLILNNTPGLGVVRITNLLKVYGDIDTIFSQKTFSPELKIPKNTQYLLKNFNIKNIEKDIAWLGQKNNHILTLDNDLYPPLLKQTDSPPPLLYVTGNPSALLSPQLAVVGSRNASVVGLKNTHSFCSDLAHKGITITSGMALGVDGKAHQAALDVGGTTIAVMGTGLDAVYPARHKNLAHEIAKNGALVSEFSIGTKPNAHNFPRRNRIICGLSLGTLVIEAALKSGTLITARQTMEINRPVMAIPGSIHSPLVKGCHLLIKQGAKLIESAQEILEELTPLAQSLSLQLKDKLEKLESNLNHEQLEIKQDVEHQNILEIIMYEATSLEKIIEKSGLSAHEVSSVLLVLELEDKIQSLPGAQYLRI